MWCHVFFCWFHILTMVNAWVFVDAYNFSAWFRFFECCLNLNSFFTRLICIGNPGPMAWSSSWTCMKNRGEDAELAM